jgi:hypothetical protein
MYKTLQTLVVKTTLQDKQSYAVETYYSQKLFAEVHSVWGWCSKHKMNSNFYSPSAPPGYPPNQVKNNHVLRLI